MTYRDFLNNILNTESASKDVKDYAQSELDKLNARNDKRRTTLTKEQLANEGIKAEIVNALEGGQMTAKALADTLGYSTQKVSALCRQLVADSTVVANDVKVKGKDTVKGYELA